MSHCMCRRAEGVKVHAMEKSHALVAKQDYSFETIKQSLKYLFQMTNISD